MPMKTVPVNEPVLDGKEKSREHQASPEGAPLRASILEGKSFMELCELGLALTWPVSLAALLGATVITVILLWR